MENSLAPITSSNYFAKLNEDLRREGLEPISARTFCILPFIQYSTTTDGEIRLCCRSGAIGHIKHDGLGDLWRSDLLEKVREDLAEGRRRPECRSCWELEDLGALSLRDGQMIQRGLENIERIIAWKKHGQLEGPHTLELKLSNLCNLKCRMCSPIASTPWIKEWDKIKEFYETGDRQAIQESYDEQILKSEPVLDHFLTNDRFLADMNQFRDGIQELEFAGGEPLLDPLHYQVLESVLHRAPEITLKYSTNLTRLGTKRFDVLKLWSRFKQIKLTISIDGYPQLNEYIRTGTVTEELEKNLAIVKSLPNVQLKASTCLSSYNALFLRETYEYVLSIGLIWYANRVRSPKFLDARTLPLELRQEAIRRLNSFDPKIFERFKTPIQDQQKSSRAKEDCVAWLSDGNHESATEFNKFLAYRKRLDEIRKIKLPELDQLEVGL